MSQEERKNYLGQLMDNLSNYIGQEVVVIFWEGGKLNGFRGQLEALTPFDCIKLDGRIITFVGPTTAIQAIALEEKKMLYYNESVESYQGFSFKDIMGLILAQEEMLGYSVRRAELEKNDEKRRK